MYGDAVSFRNMLRILPFLIVMVVLKKNGRVVAKDSGRTKISVQSNESKNLAFIF